MPKQRDLGYGPFTRDKVKAFTSILQMHMAIARAVWHRYRYRSPSPYLYLDLTAGPGFANPEQPNASVTLGSPLVFLELATKPLPMGHSKERFVDPIPFESHFFEKDPEYATELQKRIMSYQQSPLCQHMEIHQVDYAHPNYGLPALLKDWGVQEYRYGLLYVDPSGDLPDFDILAQAARALPRVEILIHISATVIKRRSRAHNIPERLMDLLNKIPKGQWLIRDTLPGDNFQWTFLMGTSAHDRHGEPLFRGLKGERFFHLDTPEGQRVLERLTYTKAERQRRGQLSFDFGEDSQDL